MEDNWITQSSKLGMGTVITHKLYGLHTQDALQAAEEETKRLERLLSRFIPASDISRVNRLAGIGEEKVSDDTFEVLLRAAEFSEACKGCFDGTIGPLVSLWAKAKEARTPPSQAAIQQLLPLVNYNDLLLDTHKKTAFLKKAGQSIDLGGTAKGFAADKVMDVLLNHGITSAFTNFGGNVAVVGAKPDGSPWHIGIRHPRKQNRLIGMVSAVNKSVVTSGDYMRCFIGRDGKRYHHILNPATGYPSESGLISATVVADSSMAADTLSTILFISGVKKGVELLSGYPNTDAVLIDANLSIYITNGLKDNFQAAKGSNINILD